MFADPGGKGPCIPIADLHDGVISLLMQGAAGAKRLVPACPVDFFVPLGPVHGKADGPGFLVDGLFEAAVVDHPKTHFFGRCLVAGFFDENLKQGVRNRKSPDVLRLE